jgi:hypothetical protein
VEVGKKVKNKQKNYFYSKSPLFDVGGFATRYKKIFALCTKNKGHYSNHQCQQHEVTLITVIFQQFSRHFWEMTDIHVSNQSPHDNHQYQDGNRLTQYFKADIAII